MLVSVDEFRLYLGGYEFTPGLEQEAINTLTAAQNQLETYLNRPVELVQVREATQADRFGRVFFSVTPVVKLIAWGNDVTIGTVPTTTIVPYTITPDPLIGDEGRVVDKLWVNYNNADLYELDTLLPNMRYIVEYIAGIDGTVHEDIKVAIKRVAAREYSRNHVATGGLRIGNIEDIEEGDTRNVGWTPSELQALQRYRKRIAL